MGTMLLSSFRMCVCVCCRCYFIFHLLLVCVFAHVCTYGHMYVEVRGQHLEIGSLPPCGFQDQIQVVSLGASVLTH